MRDIAIFGAGGLGREVACLIRWINSVQPTWRIVGFFDDGLPVGHETEYGRVLGGLAACNAWPTPLDVCVAIGTPRIVKRIVEGVTSPRVSFPNIIAPNFATADTHHFSIGRGNIICGACYASVAVKIGDFNLLNGSVVIGHDSRVGSYNTIMPDVRISGEVSVGTLCLIGCRSFIRQQIRVGTGVTLSPGSMLLTPPRDHTVYMGNPARVFRY